MRSKIPSRLTLSLLLPVALFALLTPRARAQDSQPLPPDNTPTTPADTAAPRGTNEIGSMPPKFHLTGPNGERVTQKDLLGKPVLIDFWATWCEPCMSTMPELQKIRAATRSTGLVIVGVDADHEPDKAQKFYTKHFDFTDYHKGKSVEYAFPHHAIPTSVLLAPDGTLLYIHTGTKEKNLIKAIARLGPEYAAAVKSLE